MVELARELRGEGKKREALTRFQQRLLAEELTIRSSDSTARLASALSEARVDLNPHQVDAAAFAMEAIPRGGCMLADEVGLGKTIEAGIVLGQMVAEGKNRIIILSPATLRAQWQAEMKEKFDLDAMVIDGRNVRSMGNVFDRPVPIICSIPFAANRPELLAQIPWDLVVIDEAHRLRNSHRPNNKTGKALRAALKDRPKLLLTATPLQNELTELFGLITLIDEEILGPEHSFRSRYPQDPDGAGLTEDASIDLKERLAPVVHRTLRRQVREYVRYTNRRSIVEDFTPSPEEHDLYEKVSDYLSRADAFAIEPGKKTLLTLLYRKLLASSTYAIAPTLRKLSENLERRLHAAKLGQAANSLLYEPEELKHFSEEAEEWNDDPSGSPASMKILEREVWELRQYADLADSIKINAKGEALKHAIDRVFTVSRAHRWPEKAVIFTESRRTQDYLFRLLSDYGFKDKISVLSGDAGSPEERKQLVDDFREKTQILLSTEAGAEGLNLQFCNLIINYDLPWNPQRVEQRIGRCHRYGQQRDVLVINFLNRQNAADARLYELLEKKLNLFDGVFGASDEILGALESGVDFEKRVLNIYQSFRKPDDIAKAFEALRSDLEQSIDKKMTQTRSLLMERFDGDVRRRLKVAGDQAKEAVAKRQTETKAFTGSMMDRKSLSRTQLQELAAEVKARGAEGIHYLRLDASNLPARLARLAGNEGWWFVYRFELGGLKPEERLVHIVLLKDGEGFRALPLADAEHFARLPMQEEARKRPAGISVTLAQEAAVQAARDELIRQAERKGALEVDVSRERADRFAEDCLLRSRKDVKDAREKWMAGRKEVAKTTDPSERLKARANLDRLEREYRKKLSSLHNEEETRYSLKDRNLSMLVQKAKVTEKRALIASAYFWLS